MKNLSYITFSYRCDYGDFDKANNFPIMFFNGVLNDKIECKMASYDIDRGKIESLIGKIYRDRYNELIKILDSSMSKKVLNVVAVYSAYFTSNNVFDDKKFCQKFISIRVKNIYCDFEEDDIEKFFHCIYNVVVGESVLRYYEYTCKSSFAKMERGNEGVIPEYASMFLRKSKTLCSDEVALSLFRNDNMAVVSQSVGFVVLGNYMLKDVEELLARITIIFILYKAYEKTIEDGGIAVVNALDCKDVSQEIKYKRLIDCYKFLVEFDARYFFHSPVLPSRHELVKISNIFLNQSNIRIQHEDLVSQLDRLGALARIELQTIMNRNEQERDKEQRRIEQEKRDDRKRSEEERRDEQKRIEEERRDEQKRIEQENRDERIRIEQESRDERKRIEEARREREEKRDRRQNILIAGLGVFLALAQLLSAIPVEWGVFFERFYDFALIQGESIKELYSAVIAKI